jgi:hypothetical protein
MKILGAKALALILIAAVGVAATAAAFLAEGAWTLLVFAAFAVVAPATFWLIAKPLPGSSPWSFASSYGIITAYKEQGKLRWVIIWAVLVLVPAFYWVAFLALGAFMALKIIKLAKQWIWKLTAAAVVAIPVVVASSLFGGFFALPITHLVTSAAPIALYLVPFIVALGGWEEPGTDAESVLSRGFLVTLFRRYDLDADALAKCEVINSGNTTIVRPAPVEILKRFGSDHHELDDMLRSIDLGVTALSREQLVLAPTPPDAAIIGISVRSSTGIDLGEQAAWL